MKRFIILVFTLLIPFWKTFSMECNYIWSPAAGAMWYGWKNNKKITWLVDERIKEVFNKVYSFPKCGKKQKKQVFYEADKIIFETPISYRIEVCGKYFKITDLDLGTTLTLKVEKKHFLKYKSKPLVVKKATVIPEINKLGDYYWYSVTYVAQDTNKSAVLLQPLP